jgi:hypothetical protein
MGTRLSTEPGSKNRGAYGFRLVPPAYEQALPDLTPLEGDAVSVALEWRHAVGLADQWLIEPDRVMLRERGKSLLDVRRDPPSIALDFAETVTPEVVVHPVLTPPIAILARWRGDLTLHAGSFFANDRAWAVVGAREAGKSTTLARLAERGYPLLADDLLVLDEDVVRAGPACIDLRPDVAERMPEARPLGEVGNRPRYRLTAPPGPPRAKIGGFFLMDWSEDASFELELIPPTDALRVVYEQEYMGLMGPAEPGKILDLLGTPMWRVRRPRDWRVEDECINRILEVTEAGAA